MRIRDYYKLPLYTICHPVDGFYDMKYENKGKMSIIYVNLILFWISFSFNKQYTGFVINETNPMNANTFFDLFSILAIFLLWCVANWSITTLMNGEGKFKDIAMATAYALTPMILVFVPATLFSRLLVQDEAAFYHMLMGGSIALFVILLFFGILTIHNYTVAKTIITLILTFISICLILFLMLLMGSLLQQVATFVRSIWTEIIFRI